MHQSACLLMFLLLCLVYRNFLLPMTFDLFPENSILSSLYCMARNLLPIFTLAAKNIARYIQAYEASPSTLTFCIFYYLDRHACTGRMPSKIGVMQPKAKELSEARIEVWDRSLRRNFRGNMALLTP